MCSFLFCGIVFFFFFFPFVEVCCLIWISPGLEKDPRGNCNLCFFHLQEILIDFCHKEGFELLGSGAKQHPQWARSSAWGYSVMSRIWILSWSLTKKKKKSQNIDLSKLYAASMRAGCAEILFKSLSVFLRLIQVTNINITKRFIFLL